MRTVAAAGESALVDQRAMLAELAANLRTAAEREAQRKRQQSRALPPPPLAAPTAFASLASPAPAAAPAAAVDASGGVSLAGAAAAAGGGCRATTDAEARRQVVQRERRRRQYEQRLELERLEQRRADATSRGGCAPAEADAGAVHSAVGSPAPSADARANVRVRTREGTQGRSKENDRPLPAALRRKLARDAKVRCSLNVLLFVLQFFCLLTILFFDHLFGPPHFKKSDAAMETARASTGGRRSVLALRQPQSQPQSQSQPQPQRASHWPSPPPPPPAADAQRSSNFGGSSVRPLALDRGATSMR